MMEWNSRSEKGFGSLKSGIHGRRPVKRILGGAGIRQGTENMGNGRKESAIEVEHAKESL
jgi:hypothetical protein